MASDATAPLEPQVEDETISMDLRRLSADAGLKGMPAGDQRCENCAFYLEETADISYCWHPRLRILVGAEWWCGWWEPPPSSPAGS